MADTKISGLTALASGSVDTANDQLVIVDTSAATTKKIAVTDILSLSTQAVPTGTIIDFGGTAAPTGYLACDGSAVSRTTYAALFTAISTTWGAGDGVNTFNVPNFQRRVAVGSGGSGTSTLANSVGSTGGEETHTLTTAELASHAHSHAHSAGSYATSIIGSGGGGANTGVVPQADAGTTGYSVTGTSGTDATTAGSGTAHNNMQPSAVVLKCIKT